MSSRNIWTGRLTVLIMMMIEMRKESRIFFCWGVFFILMFFGMVDVIITYARWYFKNCFFLIFGRGGRCAFY